MYLEIDKGRVLVIEEMKGLFSWLHLYAGKVDNINQKHFSLIKDARSIIERKRIVTVNVCEK